MVDCGVPLSANRVVIEHFNNSKFGSLITFHCEESNNSMTAVCGSDGEWIPNPASFMCGDPGHTPSGTGRCLELLYVLQTFSFIYTISCSYNYSYRIL